MGGRPHALVAAAVIATVVLVGVGPGGAATARAGGGPPAADVIGLDSTDSAQVAAAWQTITTAAPAIGFTGDVQGCVAGTTAQAYRTAELKTVNALRALTGVAAVTESAAASTQAQKAALMMAKAQDLSHSPGTDWPCYTAEGAAGAGSSNLYYGRMGKDASVGYVADPGANNTFVGHRRWILCPYNTTIGFGDAPTANATKVIGVGTTSWSTRDGYVAWPNPGIVPNQQAQDRGLLDRFSIQVPGGDSVANATVTIAPSGGGAVTATNLVRNDANYCSPAAVWEPSRMPNDGETWTISVKGISAAAGGTYTRTWATQFTGPAPTVPAAPTNVTATPSGTDGVTVSWTAPADGGSAITGYTVTPYVGATAQAARTFASTATTQAVTGLSVGTAYSFRVAAVNAVGTGPLSAASAAVTAGPPRYAPFTSWEAFVRRQHVDLTGGQPTGLALQGWIDHLADGSSTKGDLITALRRGDDNTANVDPVARLYRAFLGRIPDAGGLDFWIGRKRSGTWTVTKMSESFAGSNEFKTKYGALTNRQFVTRIYTDVLGRTADQGGVDFWTAQLDAKKRTRGAVMVGFSESSEYKRQQAENTDVATTYVALLGRAPTSGEASAWVARQQGGASLGDLATEVLESSEYAALVGG